MTTHTALAVCFALMGILGAIAWRLAGKALAEQSPEAPAQRVFAVKLGRFVASTSAVLSFCMAGIIHFR